MAAYLYLTEPAQMKLCADCWIYNRIPAPPPEDIRKLYRGRPPPAAAGYVTDASALVGPDPAGGFIWSSDGEAVCVCIAGQPMAFVPGPRQRGYSRNLARVGPWGNPWDEDLYQSLFGAAGVG